MATAKEFFEKVRAANIVIREASTYACELIALEDRDLPIGMEHILTTDQFKVKIDVEEIIKGEG